MTNKLIPNLSLAVWLIYDNIENMKYIKRTMRITPENDKKIKSLSSKAQSKYKLSSKGKGERRSLVSSDAVIRSAIDKLDGDEFIKSIKENLLN